MESTFPQPLLLIKKNTFEIVLWLLIHSKGKTTNYLRERKANETQLDNKHVIYFISSGGHCILSKRDEGEEEKSNKEGDL